MSVITCRCYNNQEIAFRYSKHLVVFPTNLKQNQFRFYFHPYCKLFSCASLLKPCACHTQLFFIANLKQSSFPNISVSNSIFTVYTLKTVNPSLSTYIKFSQIKNHFTKVLSIPLTCSFILQSRSFLQSNLPILGPNAPIILITSSSKTSTIAIRLTLFLQTSTTFSHSSSFTKIQRPCIPSFSYHHSYISYS